jgi:hypothetical protein
VTVVDHRVVQTSVTGPTVCITTCSMVIVEVAASRW